MARRPFVLTFACFYFMERGGRLVFRRLGVVYGRVMSGLVYACVFLLSIFIFEIILFLNILAA